MNDKIALYLVNGALGAGKTTLVDFFGAAAAVCWRASD